MIACKGKVIRCNGEAPIEKGIVVIEGDRIIAVCREDEYKLPEGTKVIEGKTVMPGMIEQHCHIGNSGKPSSLEFYMINPYEETVYMLKELSELLDAGFTTVRDVGGTLNRLKRVAKTGEIRSPRIFASGKLLSDTGGHGDELQRFPVSFSETGLSGVLIVDGVDACRRAARLQFREGADFIKICTTGGVMSEGDHPQHAYFSAEEIRAFVEEAELKGTYVSAHAEGNKGIRNALDCGVKSIEHGTYIDDYCIEKMLKNGAWLIPTLSTMYLLTNMKEKLAPWTREKVDGIYETHCMAVRKAHKAGVMLGLGTDFIYDRSMMPYGKNAMELKLMCDVGLTPMESLMTATKNGSHVVNMDGEVGTLEVGKLADIIAVDGDPLENISCLQQAENIKTVILEGAIVKNII